MPPKLPVNKRKRHTSASATGKRKRRPRLLTCASTLHLQSAHIVRRVLLSDTTRRNGASIKSLTLAEHIENKKATHAVVCETLRHRAIIDTVLKAGSLTESIHQRMAPETAYVLIFELLFGKGLENCTGPAESKILSVKETLKHALVSCTINSGNQNIQDLTVARYRPLPRYVRVNRFKISVEDAVIHYRKMNCDPIADERLSDVLKLPAGIDLHTDPLVESASVVLQGYGSCMAAHALAPVRGWNILDACAAPGNKTTHLASILQGTGKVIALDIDKERYTRLERVVLESGTKNIQCRHIDFLETDPALEDLSSIDAILLDPSCTGSGNAASRLDALLPSSQFLDDTPSPNRYLDKRLKRLSSFQTKALRHAFLFPSAKRVVYSTCSIYEEENERVVEAVLPIATEHGFQLKEALPTWHRRGHPLFEGCEHMIRIGMYSQQLANQNSVPLRSE